MSKVSRYQTIGASLLKVLQFHATLNETVPDDPTPPGDSHSTQTRINPANAVTM